MRIDVIYPIILGFVAMITKEMVKEDFWKNLQENSKVIQDLERSIIRDRIKNNRRNLQNTDINVLNRLLAKDEAIFYGEWWSNDNSTSNFDYLDSNHGIALMIFQYNAEKGFLDFTEIQFYNPKYYDERLVQYIMDITDTFDNTSQKFQSDGTITHYDKYYHLSRQNDNSIYVNSSIDIQFFNNKNETQNITELSQINITVNSKGNNGSINFQASLMLDDRSDTLQSILYCLYISLICSAQLYSILALIKYFSENDQDSNKLSLICIGFCTIFDAYQCLANLYLALVNPSQLQYFLIPAFFYFILSTIFEMRLLVIVWRARYYNEFQNTSEVRRGIAIFYLKFYISLFSFLILMYYFYLYNWFVIWTSLLIVPQIVHNVMRGNNPKFFPHYVWGIIFTKLALPIYFRGCPENIRDYAPSVSFCVCYALIVLFQILILYLQFKFKPRFFIPSMCLPKKYNYYIEYEFNSQTMEVDECAICLNPLHKSQQEIDEQNNNQNSQVQNQSTDGSHEDNYQSIVDPYSIQNGNPKDVEIQQPLIKKVKIMRTTCGHRFHIHCLTNWLEIKLECPTCRSKCPAI